MLVLGANNYDTSSIRAVASCCHLRWHSLRLCPRFGSTIVPFTVGICAGPETWRRGSLCACCSELSEGGFPCCKDS